MELTDKKEFLEPEMIMAALNFWFRTEAHFRSPFPENIHDELKIRAIKDMESWAASLSHEIKKEFTDELLAERFEEILFDAGLNLVKTEDEKLTIRYPFMIRTGDRINVMNIPDKDAENLVVSREFYKNGDFSYLKVKIRNIGSGEEWETDFELPE